MNTAQNTNEAFSRLIERRKRREQKPTARRKKERSSHLVRVPEIIREIRKPGKVFAGIATQSSIEYVAVEKQDIAAWLKACPNPEDCGIIAHREKDGNLYIDRKDQ